MRDRRAGGIDRRRSPSRRHRECGPHRSPLVFSTAVTGGMSSAACTAAWLGNSRADGPSHCCPGQHSPTAADRSHARGARLGRPGRRCPRSLSRGYRSSTSVPRRHRDYGPHGLPWRPRLPRPAECPRPRARRPGWAIHGTDGPSHCCPGLHFPTAADRSHARGARLATPGASLSAIICRRVYRPSTSLFAAAP